MVVTLRRATTSARRRTTPHDAAGRRRAPPGAAWRRTTRWRRAPRFVTRWNRSATGRAVGAPSRAPTAESPPRARLRRATPGWDVRQLGTGAAVGPPVHATAPVPLPQARARPAATAGAVVAAHDTRCGALHAGGRAHARQDQGRRRNEAYRP